MIPAWSGAASASTAAIAAAAAARAERGRHHVRQSAEVIAPRRGAGGRATGGDEVCCTRHARGLQARCKPPANRPLTPDSFLNLCDSFRNRTRGYLEYNHLNPVRRGWVASPGHWRWSSAHEWLDGASPVLVCDLWK